MGCGCRDTGRRFHQLDPASEVRRRGMEAWGIWLWQRWLSLDPVPEPSDGEDEMGFSTAVPQFAPEMLNVQFDEIFV